MQTTDARSRTAAGFDALRRGDAAGARPLLEAAVAESPKDETAWLGLAVACHRLGDRDARLAAVDRVLELNPANLRAILLKGDHFAEAGDDRAATAFYRFAMKATPQPQQLPPDLIRDLERARVVCDRVAADYEAFLRERLAAAGLGAELKSARFEQSLDLMLGKRQVYFQEPRAYFFPGLPQRQFYEREAFAWIPALEARTDDIRAELTEVLRDDAAFSPYLERIADRPQVDSLGLLGNPAWGAFYLWKNGSPVDDNIARCPKTMAALENVPLAQLPNRTPSILFSLLKPGTRIPPHNGLINTRLICHLPLVVPEGCGFRVGNETRRWREGEVLIFDDSIEHEAWNDSAQTRVILLFDIRRPEMTEAENALVAAAFEAIDAYGGVAVAWDD